MSTQEDLRKAADVIASICNDEPMIRAAISRYYYSAFHRGYAYHAGLPKLGSVGTARGRHEQLIAQLTNPDPKLADDIQDRSIAVGKYLRLLVSKRVESDYKLNIRLGAADLKEVVTNIDLLFIETQ